MRKNLVIVVLTLTLLTTGYVLLKLHMENTCLQRVVVSEFVYRMTGQQGEEILQCKEGNCRAYCRDSW